MIHVVPLTCYFAFAFLLQVLEVIGKAQRKGWWASYSGTACNCLLPRSLSSRNRHHHLHLAQSAADDA